MKVYLAGPLTGLTWEQAAGWRAYAGQYFETHEIHAFDPMRWISCMPNTVSNRKATIWDNVRAVIRRDKVDLLRSDAILMNLDNSDRVSIGTMLELGWADQAGIPVVVVMKDGGVHDHPMVRDIAVVVVPTLEEGCRAIVEVIDP